jgi:gas vesicle protein
MKKGYIIGLAAAVAAGVAAGMLLAPEKGKDLRKKIADNGLKLSNKIKDGLKPAKSKLHVNVKELTEV